MTKGVDRRDFLTHGTCALLAGAQTHPATYTLNDVMQAPFASDMLAAPTGAAVAWVFNAKGCSNIWGSRSPTRAATAWFRLGLSRSAAG